MPVNTNKLIGIIAERRLSQKDVADHLEMSANTFYSKMNKKVFGSDEIEAMVKFLEIRNPWNIFFDCDVT